MYRLNIDVRLDFPQITHIGEARRIDPAVKQANKADYQRQWREANRERFNAAAREYRHRKAAAGQPYNHRKPKTARRQHCKRCCRPLEAIRT